MSIFFNIKMKKPPLSCPYLIKKRQNCQKYNILWTKKDSGKNKHNFGQYNTVGGWGENWWINLR